MDAPKDTQMKIAVKLTLFHKEDFDDAVEAYKRYALVDNIR
jgi:hypothetical protein